MNNAQIRAKKRRKAARDGGAKWWLNLGTRKPVPTLDEYFAKGGGGPYAQ